MCSCSNDKFENEFSSYLEKQNDFEILHIVNYNKHPSKKYFKNRFKPLVNKNLLMVDSSYKDNEISYTLKDSHLSKDLVINKTEEKLTFICGKLKFHSITSIEKSSDNNFYKVLTKYNYIDKSLIFLNDPYRLIGDPENKEDTKFISFLVKKDWFGFNIKSEDKSVLINKQ